MASGAAAARYARKPAKKQRLKTVGRVLLFVIGIPAVLVLVFYGWLMTKDESNGKLVSSGVTRSYLLYVPKSYARSRPAPLVISLHGAAGWPAFQRDISHWNDVADKHGFIVVYPAGTPLIGERGPRVWPMGPESLDLDVKFISDLIDKLEADYNIDRSRIYADGLSNGGGMAYALGCKLSHRVAAIGAVAAALSVPAGLCNNGSPEPVIAFHGTADHMAPYDGGRSGDPVSPQQFPAIRDWISDWAKHNHCTGDPVDTPVNATVHRLSYTNCALNADVVLYTVEGGGHAWPGGKPLPEWWVGRTPREIDATRLLWDFFVQHPRGPK